MLTPPFDIISCSWPRPIEQRNNQWASEPEWDAPLMSTLPQPHWDILNGEVCWTVNWRDLFRSGLKLWNPHMSGEMRGFHLVFRLRINASGTLIFWDDDGSIIRRNGIVIHTDRSAHPLRRGEIEVESGDILEIAQWQLGWDWLWGARLSSPDLHIPATTQDVLSLCLEIVLQRLRQPDGPPLKMYTNSRAPVRVIASVYSMILNGYVPSAVYLFGEDQWDEQARMLITSLLPFATVVTKQQVTAQLRSLGTPRLVDLALRYWFVTKMCVALLHPPEECCFMDDDVFILDRVDDALKAFQSNDLVFSPDQDLGDGYARTWGTQIHNTRKFNAGLYWLRHVHDHRWLASQTLRGRLNPNEPFFWEQGFIASMYMHKNTLELPSQRYLFPIFDGLPGGLLGYDYAHNPCNFASIHFAGIAEKPSDGMSIHILLQLLESAHNLNGIDIVETAS